MGQVKVPGKGQFRPQQTGCYHAHVLVPGAGAVKQHAIAPVHRQVFPGVKTQARHAVHLAQRGTQLQRLAGTVLPHSLQFLDGQVIIALAGGDFRCGALGGFHLAQNAALETDQAFAAAQDILLAGQKLLHPQLRAVHRHPHVGGVVRQADKKIILQGAAAIAILPQQVLRGKHTGSPVFKLLPHLVFQPGGAVQQAGGGGIHRHGIGAAVHTVQQRGAQCSQTNAPHPRQQQTWLQLGGGGQRRQRHLPA